MYIYLLSLLLYNSSILDIKHSPYYIALGSTHKYKVIYWRPTLLYYNIYLSIYLSAHNIFSIK